MTTSHFVCNVQYSSQCDSCTGYLAVSARGEWVFASHFGKRTKKQHCGSLGHVFSTSNGRSSWSQSNPSWCFVHQATFACFVVVGHLTRKTEPPHGCPITAYREMNTKHHPSSQQALLNKRRLRCRGPPFLRLLETMRFVEQMLSAVSHLLSHGVAHNDIKPGRRARGALEAHQPRTPSNLSLSKRRNRFFLSSRIRVRACVGCAGVGSTPLPVTSVCCKQDL